MRSSQKLERRIFDLENELLKPKVRLSADRICAYIKCIEELSAGNKEFEKAQKTILTSIENLGMPGSNILWTSSYRVLSCRWMN